jgi:hypothetical protein
MALGAMLGTAAAAQTEVTVPPARAAEFSKLVQQRNELYGQLFTNDSSDSPQAMKWVQNQLDITERRLGELAAEHHLEVPPPPARSAGLGEAIMTPAASGAPGFAADGGSGGSVTTQQRAEFNKLVLRRNKLHANLTRLDEQAAELIRRGQKPIVLHAQQVSVQDELDLVELQIAIQATRHGLAVPPVPGRDTPPSGRASPMDDEVNRNLEQAFARGRQRALQRLGDDTDRFLGSLDFVNFLGE